ncbi:MAG: class I SAM-dependent methyltransferase [Gammaproteobacteria bacterium]
MAVKDFPSQDSTAPLQRGGEDVADYLPLLDNLGRLLSQPAPEPLRVFHGRGHRYPGLEHVTLDWYPPVLLLTFYQEPVHSAQLLEKILAADVHKQVKSVVLQRRQRHRADAELLWGEQFETCTVVEGGLSFEVRPGVNRNVGLFLDMRPLREWLQTHSQGRNVLNLFAYTCSLSVAAVAGGARQVVSVDMSRPSIQWGLRNHRLNNQDASLVRSLPHNIFTSWGRIQQLGRYDCILVDPPTRQRGSFDVAKNYPAVIKRLPKLIKPGADVIATINSPYQGPGFLIEQFEKFAPALRFVEFLPIAAEFQDKYPERGLNICLFREA